MTERFPKPYINDCKIDKQYMDYADFDFMGIGATKALMAFEYMGPLSIDHVGQENETERPRKRRRRKYKGYY